MLPIFFVGLSKSSFTLFLTIPDRKTSRGRKSLQDASFVDMKNHSALPSEMR
jgi:hypothetical protein